MHAITCPRLISSTCLLLIHRLCCDFNVTKLMAAIIPAVIFSAFAAIILLVFICWFFCVRKTGKEADAITETAPLLGESSFNTSVTPESSVYQQEQGLAIGIDVGELNSRFAAVEDGKIRVLLNENGQLLTPTALAAPHSPSSAPIVYGLIAQEMLKNKRSYVAENLCRNICNPKARVNWPLSYDSREKTSMSPTTLMALMLSYIKKCCERALNGRTVSQAVLAIPTSFNDHQRQAFIDAAKVAGFTKIRLQSKLALGGLYYICNSYSREEIYRFGGYVLSFRYGSESMEAAVMQLQKGVITVMANAGNQNGGADLTEEFFQACLKKIESQHEGKIDDFLRDKIAVFYLRQDCEKKKVILSAAKEVHFVVEFGEKPTVIKFSFTRPELEAMVSHLDEEIPRLFDYVLAECGRKHHIPRQEIGHVYMFGGACRFPKVKAIVHHYFDNTAFVHTSALDDHAVVQGAAIQAAHLNEQTVLGLENTVLKEVTGFSLNCGEEQLVESSEKLPLVKQLSSDIIKNITDNLNFVQKFGFTGESYEVSLANAAGLQFKDDSLSLLIDDNGILYAFKSDSVEAPERAALFKRYEMPKKVIRDKQFLLQRIEAEKVRRRSDVASVSSGGRSLLDKLVSSMQPDIPAIIVTDSDNDVLMGEDYLA